MAITALLNRESIIERVAKGEMLSDIAQSLGIAPPNISKYLAKDQEYRQAREDGTEVRLKEATDALKELDEIGLDEQGKIVGFSKNVSNLARLRVERLKAVQWFAEREFPHRWGAKQQVEHLNAPTINFVFGSAENAPQHAQVIENESQ